MSFFQKVLGRFFPREKPSLKQVMFLFCLIFVIWALYRYFPEVLPAWVEELILKPLVWLLPTFLIVKKVEKKPLSSLGFSLKKLFPALYWGVGLGMVFALEGFITGILKYGGIRIESSGSSPLSFFTALGISFATAFSEETVFRGYIFSRLWRIWEKEWLANLVSSFLFVVIHLPIAVFVLGYTPAVMAVYLMLIFIYSLGSAFVFARTGNIVSSILLHVLWYWPIILFK